MLPQENSPTTSVRRVLPALLVFICVICGQRGNCVAAARELGRRCRGAALAGDREPDALHGADRAGARPGAGFELERQARDHTRSLPLDPRLAARSGSGPAGGPAQVHVRHQWPPILEPPATGKSVLMQPRFWSGSGLMCCSPRAVIPPAWSGCGGLGCGRSRSFFACTASMTTMAAPLHIPRIHPETKRDVAKPEKAINSFFRSAEIGVDYSFAKGGLV